MSDKITAEYRERMNGIARALDTVLNGDERPKKVGFLVLMAEFGKFEDGRVNYISNAERADMIVMMKELLARWEGRYAEGGTDAQ